ncbi:hypothetical protein [Streptomyces zagrosensis]|uniref:Uncharacterized protein n=1 Tax=Streptomyces zagrosensis TaxID=1042984 RepID=A0A7W9QBI8_9ACTN|nr:hypothetical protein [Streptomyces zagrosensis]MBB5937208.1 hypothetical protein [Streptomyces zagrosensis]
MTTNTSATPNGGDSALPPIPWLGPTLHELVPGIAPGTRPLPLRRQAAQALAKARQDSLRHGLIKRADQASRGPVAALVAEMLTPPLPPQASKERP